MTKEFARQRLEQYYHAEECVLLNQRYKIGSRELEKASLRDIKAGIEYWENKVAALEAGRNPNAVRMARVVPRDL